jgi:hypothetical protein
VNVVNPLALMAGGFSQDDLVPGPVINGRTGETIKEAGSVLPRAVLRRLSELSHQLMDFPDDYVELALRYYRPYLKGEDTGQSGGGS